MLTRLRQAQMQIPWDKFVSYKIDISHVQIRSRSVTAAKMEKLFISRMDNVKTPLHGLSFPDQVPILSWASRGAWVVMVSNDNFDTMEDFCDRYKRRSNRDAKAEPTTVS